jgi:uncharacterized protein (TIGR02147 family)
MLEANRDQEKLNFRVWLQKEFTDRCRKNPRYSLRAFAKLLGMEAASVSQILSGKREASTKVITRICDRLSVNPRARFQLLLNVKKRVAKAQTEPAPPSFQQLTADAFSVIADWYHYAILELTFTENFDSSPNWIAKKLGITPTEAKVALDRLERLELIELIDGRLQKTQAFLTNGPDGFSAPALKELQRQLLQKALDAIDLVPQEEKDVTSMTMAINPAKLPEARRRIKNFRRQLCAFLEEGPRTRVYNLGVQLYPISQPTNLKEKTND